MGATLPLMSRNQLVSLPPFVLGVAGVSGVTLLRVTWCPGVSLVMAVPGAFVPTGGPVSVVTGVTPAMVAGCHKCHRYYSRELLRQLMHMHQSVMNAAGFSGATLCLGATAVFSVTLTGATGVLVVIVMSLLDALAMGTCFQ